LDSSETTITVEDDVFSNNDIIKIDSEIFRITSSSSENGEYYDYTVVRGFNSSTAAAHNGKQVIYKIGNYSGDYG
jgi:hypothetical protein